MRKIFLIMSLILFISIAGVSASDTNQTVDDTLTLSLSNDDVVGSADNGTFTDLQKRLTMPMKVQQLI